MGLDYSSPGISFDLKNGRIFVYKTTAEAIGHPEYARFMFSPEDRVFGIQACGIDDEGAHRFRVSGDQYRQDHGTCQVYLVSAQQIGRC